MKSKKTLLKAVKDYRQIRHSVQERIQKLETEEELAFQVLMETVEKIDGNPWFKLVGRFNDSTCGDHP